MVAKGSSCAHSRTLARGVSASGWCNCKAAELLSGAMA